MFNLAKWFVIGIVVVFAKLRACGDADACATDGDGCANLNANTAARSQSRQVGRKTFNFI